MAKTVSWYEQSVTISVRNYLFSDRNRTRDEIQNRKPFGPKDFPFGPKGLLLILGFGGYFWEN